MRGVNVTAGEVPLRQVKLDFRVAAVEGNSKPAISSISPDDKLQLMKLWDEGTVTSPRQTELATRFVWLNLAANDLVKDLDAERLVLMQVLGLPRDPALLVSNEPSQTMLSSDTGDRAWKVEHAELAEDASGALGISLTLDEAGGTRLRELTERNLNQPLAVIINDRVHVVPTIRSPLSSKIQISGHFSKELAQQLVDYFNDAAAATASMPEKIRQMLVMVDALGSITVQYGFSREQVGSEVDTAIEKIEQIIRQHSVESVNLMGSHLAVRTIESALLRSSDETGMQALNMSGGRVPAAPASLDFRIAAARNADDMTGLRMKMLESPNPQKELAEDQQLAANYQWVEINKDAAKEMMSQPDLITNLVPASPYLLVSRKPAETMLASDTGERAWKVLGAALTDDPSGHPAIALTLNEAGGKRLSELTESHLEKHLVVIINNRAYMAPRIVTKIGNQVQITGPFDKQLAQLLVDAFNAAAKEE